MEEAWREVVAGSTNTSCKATNTVAETRRCDPRYISILAHSAESWKEEEGLARGIRLCEGWKSTNIMLADILAVGTPW